MPTASRHEPGRLIDGRYRLLSHLADGGMATVWLALDERLEREVALKIMKPGLADDPAFVDRFRREARSAARLSHPGLVAMFDQGQDGSAMFLAMEFVPGRTLRQALADDAPLPHDLALDILDQLLDALASAHRAGLVHRDIKPENVLVRPDGVIKLADFGLTRAVEAATSTGTAGVLLGTVSYLSPEQVEHGLADARSDVYAVGLLLYEMLTGRKAFDGETPIHVAYQHVHGSVPSPSTQVSGIPEPLDRLVALATARDPSQRPEDAADLLVELRRTRALMSDPLKAAPGAAVPAVVPPATLPAQPSQEADTLDAPVGSGGPRLDATQRLDLNTTAGSADLALLDHTAELPIAPGSRATGSAAPQLAEPRSPSRQSAPTTRSPRRRAGWVAALLALLVAAGAGGWYVYLGPGSMTAVPAVTQLPLDDAEASLHARGLTTTVAESFSETVTKGLIISSEPASGTALRKGTAVDLVVSKGKERYDAPDLVGTAASAAKETLAKNNLTLGTQRSAFDEKIAKGKVVSQEPQAGTALKKGTAVAIVVSKGREPIDIPDLRNTPIDEAAQRLRSLGLTVSLGEPVNDDAVAKGRVLRQDPAKGTLFRGETVTLVESKGPVLVSVPSVIGRQRDEASQILRAAGLKVSVTSLFGGYFGTVRFQDPVEGTLVPKGSTVTIQII